MKQIRHFFWIMITLIGIVVLLGDGTVAEAKKKYYSLSNIGLSGCTEDDTDYAILSIRGNVIRYETYRISKKTCEWERVGEVKTAKLTAATKCYVGDAEQVSSSLRHNGRNSQKNDNTNRRHLVKKSKNIDTEKWIYRVQKRNIRKYISRRNNEIQIANGKVTKIAVRLFY